jgi:hypothetical protein
MRNERLFGGHVMNAKYAVVMMVLVALALVALPASAAINKIPAGEKSSLVKRDLMFLQQ